MVQYSADFARRVAALCCAKFDDLPKSGKPQPREWTVLAGVVQCIETSMSSRRVGTCMGENSRGDVGCGNHDLHLSVVALGTGTKCLGDSKWCELGTRIHDSHAEVVAKRSFQRYLMDQAQVQLSGQPSIFETIISAHGPKLKLRKAITFHLYVSFTPCGDGSIFPQQCLDTNRTGAKCAPGEALDPKAPGSLYHRHGVLRTKPGRGPFSSSHCCSDKLFRWSVLGAQGCLLMGILQCPVYFESITFGACPFNYDAINRALHT
ncbi:hypothetical protein HAZT_HAZT000678, partial [Hyalella azteca]